MNDVVLAIGQNIDGATAKAETQYLTKHPRLAVSAA